ncbi:MAG: dTDP-4-dehydrorhamnose 3,5-epimerase [Solirubrobacteraceae bacterium]|jgi:dTDP-4-dehydrorhamnose 3,5-epimerase
MIINPTALQGVMIVELEPSLDARGSWARVFDADVFAAHGLDARVAQCSTSVNRRAGTLRGLHYQTAPYGEGKLVRCARGRIFDVAVDLRAGSPTHKRWVSVELSASNGLSLFIAEGCAHGFQTLEDNTEVHYQMTSAFVPEAYTGARWNDRAFAIEWPEPPGGERIMSERDRNFHDYVT